MMRMGRWFQAALCGLAVALLPLHAFAQSVNFDLGQGPTTTARLVQIVILITVLSLAPSILVMVTSFTRIIVVLSFMRTALGTQTKDPSCPSTPFGRA